MPSKSVNALLVDALAPSEDFSDGPRLDTPLLFPIPCETIMGELKIHAPQIGFFCAVEDRQFRLRMEVDNTMGDFVRQKMREQSMMRQVMPPMPIDPGNQP